MEVLTNITWNGPSLEFGEREIFKTFKKKHFPYVLECFAPCRQESLVLHECPEVWTNINFQ